MKSKTFSIVAIIVALGLLGGLIGLIAHVRSQQSTVIEVTTANFKDVVINSPEPVYIEFYAPNCKPCAKQAPIVDKLAAEYAGKVRFVRIDAVNQPEIAAAIGIEAVPTHLLIRVKDKVVVGAVGFLEEADLRKFLDDGLKAQPKPAQPAPGPSNGQPAGKPADPANKPADPANKPADPANKPADPANKPTDSGKN